MSEFLPALTQSTPRGSARSIDIQLDPVQAGVGGLGAVQTAGIARGGVGVNTFLTSATGTSGVINGRPCNGHANGNGARLFRAIPQRIGTAHGGTINPESAGLVGVRVILAINATADADAVNANTDLGISFFPADGRAAASYHQLLNDGGNIRDRGFGLLRYNGAWRWFSRQFDNDGNAIPLENLPLNWPSQDVTDWVAADFIFRQQTAAQAASVELRLNGVKQITRGWDTGSTFPRPDIGSYGDGYGWAMFFRSISGPAADGRSLYVANVHLVAGPDEPGVLWDD